jgi:hypothetical protein
MPSKPPFDARAYATRMVGRAVEDTLIRSRRPLKLKEIRVLASYLTMNPKVSTWWITEAISYARRGDIQNAQFQAGLRDALWEQWNILRRDSSTPDAIYQTLHAYFYPSAGVESYLLRPDYAYVKDLCIAGGTAVYSGPKGSGKTDIATSDIAKLAGLKKDHLENGAKSRLAVYHRAGGRFFKPLDDITEMDLDRVVAEPEPEPLEPLSKNPSRPRKLDLYNAKYVKFPTNISISKKSIVGGDIQFGGRVSDIVLDSLKNDEAGGMSDIYLDEFGIAANKRRGMTTAAWVIGQFLATHRKFYSAIGVIAQDAVRQLSAELVENAQTHIEKPSITELDEAIISVSGLFYQQRFRDVPPSPVVFDTQSNASFFPDITLTTVWDYVSAKQREMIEIEGVEWNHLIELKIAREFIEKNRATVKDLAEGRSGILRSEIRTYLGKQDPTTGKLYTPERVARILAEDLEQDWKKEVLPIVKQVVADMAEEDRQRKERGGKPPTPEEIQAQYEKDKQVAENIPVTEDNEDEPEEPRVEEGT